MVGGRDGDGRGEAPASSAVQLRDRLASGAVSCEALVGSCLETVAATETGTGTALGAWAWLDAEHALGRARELDALRRRGRGVGPLHGLPVGLKDVIDTKGIPTANGCALDAGRVPGEDAALVARLRAAGALILGKTETTELAFMHPARTRNPAAPGRTPGGSSSGSAAAVAAGAVPLALGTQTGGSVIRPASYCGVVGFKPSFGSIGRTGVLAQSPSLDTVGTFSSCVEDAALLCDALFGHDPGDPATRPSPAPRLLDVALSDPPARPVLAFAELPFAERADADVRGALGELAAFLTESAFAAPLPDAFAQGPAAQRTVQLAELAKHYARYARRGADALSAEARAAIDEGRTITAVDYLAARDWAGVLNAGLDALFDRCDALVVPAATGAAPAGFDTTGDPIFNGLWTLCGVPCVTLPLLESADGHPMGVQLVGRRGDDARLLRTARWLANLLEQEA